MFLMNSAVLAEIGSTLIISSKFVKSIWRVPCVSSKHSIALVKGTMGTAPVSFDMFNCLNQSIPLNWTIPSLPNTRKKIMVLCHFFYDFVNKTINLFFQISTDQYQLWFWYTLSIHFLKLFSCSLVRILTWNNITKLIFIQYAESFDPVSIIVLEPSLLLLQDLHNLTGDTVIKADTEKMLYFKFWLFNYSDQ